MWDDAIKAFAEELGLEADEVQAFTPETMSLNDAVAFAQTIEKAAFMVIPTQHQDAGEYERAIGQVVNIHEWLSLPGKVICTLQKWRRVASRPTIGAMSPEDRQRQIKSNCETVSQRVKFPWNAFNHIHNKTALIVGYGPSLHQTWKEVGGYSRMEDVDMVTSSGSHDFFVAKGIVPKFHVECDPRAHKTLMVTPKEGVKYYPASTVHPSYIENLKGHDVSLWHAANQADEKFIQEIEPDEPCIDGGGCVAIRAIALFYCLGYRNFDLYGVDFSFTNQSKQWAGRHRGKIQEVVEVKCGERKFWTSPLMTVYATQFWDMLKHLSDAHFAFHGDGLLQEMARESVKRKAA